VLVFYGLSVGWLVSLERGFFARFGLDWIGLDGTGRDGRNGILGWDVFYMGCLSICLVCLSVWSVFFFCCCDWKGFPYTTRIICGDLYSLFFYLFIYLSLLCCLHSLVLQRGEDGWDWNLGDVQNCHCSVFGRQERRREDAAV